MYVCSFILGRAPVGPSFRSWGLGYGDVHPEAPNDRSTTSTNKQVTKLDSAASFYSTIVLLITFNIPSSLRATYSIEALFTAFPVPSWTQFPHQFTRDLSLHRDA